MLCFLFDCCKTRIWMGQKVVVLANFDSECNTMDNTTASHLEIHQECQIKNRIRLIEMSMRTIFRTFERQKQK